MTKYILMLCLVLGMESCAVFVKPKPTRYENSAIINKQYDKVWNSAIYFLSQNNFPFKDIEKSSGLLSTEVILTDSVNIDYCDCGHATMSTYTVYYNATKLNLTFNLERISEDQTKVTIFTFWGCKYSDINTLRGYSRGYLEAEIFKHLKQ